MTKNSFAAAVTFKTKSFYSFYGKNKDKKLTNLLICVRNLLSIFSNINIYYSLMESNYNS